jgi:hypothetical protein
MSHYIGPSVDYVSASGAATSTAKQPCNFGPAAACVGPATLIRRQFVDGERGHFQVGLKVGFRLDDG